MTGSTMANQRQPAGFAISDILELDRQSSEEINPGSVDTTPLYSPHDLPYMQRQWHFPEAGKWKFRGINSFFISFINPL